LRRSLWTKKRWYLLLNRALPLEICNAATNRQFCIVNIIYTPKTIQVESLKFWFFVILYCHRRWIAWWSRRWA
jgi:hypothetical protein